MQVLPIWGLAIPLPAVMMITVSLYMVVLGVGLWIRYCLKDYCSLGCGSCCPNISVCEQCFRLAVMCDCRLPGVSSFLPDSCSSPSVGCSSDPVSREECLKPRVRQHGLCLHLSAS
ncbi:uncharacterized protein LOC124864495 isoform X1 [Girardinichthys multiradiatus]|uniref:uncharacterized protein LOC124863153 isoform X1 n=1 Tax=Girardinichthys multiradiatus TaxID=208333 RepID=UPI001FAE62FE|nr:uncharacterized protein LOC124863153 isoform X1 [Girardinichthys multiradiatus]XP_047213369.1 uncharacterized protein LOC124863153 isoform X1 [Girardinichthys multiradiatus]XP_047213370.1 uncharacterized protein LOC124863153 isoform X1 [Girardinichthys multiradiatus]XP_047215251.1 uncharacterized protein LOC124864495 isoform X1 [Girardinichthys multiradiatus]XP_047215252.1 uncharacterized protein LOC124864495 isoform X1 [Girardinichthys multiradiatus]XP_047215254.1 uncharacterized protein L